MPARSSPLLLYFRPRSRHTTHCMLILLLLLLSSLSLWMKTGPVEFAKRAGVDVPRAAAPIPLLASAPFFARRPSLPAAPHTLNPPFPLGNLAPNAMISSSDAEPVRSFSLNHHSRPQHTHLTLPSHPTPLLLSLLPPRWPTPIARRPPGSPFRSTLLAALPRPPSSCRSRRRASRPTFRFVLPAPQQQREG